MTNKTYAVIKNNFVVDLILFDPDVTEATIETFREHYNADKIIWCDPNMGIPYIDGDILNNKFRPANPAEGFVWDESSWMWIPPIEKTPDTETHTYVFDVPSWSWVPVSKDEVAAATISQ